MSSFADRIAICSWSLRPENADDLLDQVRTLEIPRIQVALDPLRLDPAGWEFFGERCRDNGIETVSGMFVTEGEDYSSLESIRRTGGIVPHATWETNRKNIRENAEIASGLGLNLVTFHAGFMPHQADDPDFAGLLERVREVADVFAEKGIEIAFETGQEDAETLRLFLQQLDRSDVGVNFDPANMLLYDKGDPIRALRVLSPWLKQCHIKDARKTRRPGAWGEEVPVGAGEVDWAAFFGALRTIDFTGYCAIEREAGEERLKDIRTAWELVAPLAGGRGPVARSKAPVRIGIVGSGFMAATHIRAYQKLEGAKIAALCNPSGRNFDGDFSRVTGNIGSSDPVRLDMSGVETYRDFERMLAESSIDLVDVCSPTGTHAAHTIAALQAGKHVLCEKPVARNSEQARAMAKAAGESSSFYMPGMCLRFWPEWAWLKRAITENRYGRVLAARFRRVAEPPAWGQANYFSGEQSGGALFDLHVHDTDFVQYCFGKPIAVFSTGYSKFSGAIDHVVTQYTVAGGGAIHAEGAWSMTPGFGFNMAYTVNFERATADYDIARTPAPLRLFEEGRSPRDIRCGTDDGYFLELKSFLDSVRAGEAPSIVTPEDGVLSLEICEAEEKSVHSAEPVKC
jgi:predicted dehydrogenase/sugar phosphate isomerase/epimerase